MHMPWINVVISDNHVGINDELFVFDEILQEQIKLITYSNGYKKLAWKHWRVSRRYFQGFLAKYGL